MWNVFRVFTPFQVKIYEILENLNDILIESHEESLLYNIVIYERYVIFENFQGTANFLSNDSKNE